MRIRIFPDFPRLFTLSFALIFRRLRSYPYHSAFLDFSGQQARCRCQVGGRHLPSVSYGQSYQQTYFDIGFSVSSVFAFLDRRVSLHILAGRLSSNSSSAALIFVFCATRRIRFVVSDLFQKRPSWRGRAVAGPLCLQKKKKKKKKEKKN